MNADESPTAPEAETKKKPRFPVLAFASLAAGSAAAALVFFLVPDALILAKSPAGGEQNKPATEHAEKSTATSGSHDSKSKSGGGHDGVKDKDAKGGSEKNGTEEKFRIVDGQGVYSPEPIVVSVKPVGRVRYLKLGFVVETSPEFERTFIERENRLRDTLNIYLRAVDIAVLEDPASMGRIRSQIARRVAVVMDPAPIHAVLITDFILS